jgi:uncharacterized membrane protein YbjE (DUF340 family)
MNFANAALLIAAVYGIAELVKSLLPDFVTSRSWAVAILVVAVAFAAVFLVAATTWAHTQVIGNVPLDKMSVADKVLVSVFAAGAAGLVNKSLVAVTNIGDNQP